jgi:preprotein translocase subunit Sss1
MKYLLLIANGLVGLVFFVFGLNGFLNFMPMPPMEGDTAVFAGVLMSSGYMYAIKVLETIFGAMILFNFHRPLAYMLLAPIVIGIFFFEIFIAKEIGIGLVLTGLLGFLIYTNRERYMPIVSA